MAKSICVVEVDGPQNQQLAFRPLGRRLRGRFDARRMVDGHDLARQYPTAIPGQRIELTSDGHAAILEPLHDAEHEDLKEKLSAIYRLNKPREDVGVINLDTWAFALTENVKCGLMKVISGRIPDFDRVKATATGSPKDPMVLLTATVAAQTELIRELMSR